MSVLAFLLAAAVGALQVGADTVLYGAFFARRYAKGVCAVLLKLALYGVFLWLLFRLLQAYVVMAAVGYAAGFFPLLLAYCFVKLKKN